MPLAFWYAFSSSAFCFDSTRCKFVVSALVRGFSFPKRRARLCGVSIRTGLPLLGFEPKVYERYSVLAHPVPGILWEWGWWWILCSRCEEEEGGFCLSWLWWWWWWWWRCDDGESNPLSKRDRTRPKLTTTGEGDASDRRRWRWRRGGILPGPFELFSIQSSVR